jgi:hypothetical protein
MVAPKWRVRVGSNVEKVHRRRSGAEVVAIPTTRSAQTQRFSGSPSHRTQSGAMCLCPCTHSAAVPQCESGKLMRNHGFRLLASKSDRCCAH